eukprot:COSAG02_NODE_1181_length_14030_cov_6.652143_9_plen_73_part_00
MVVSHHSVVVIIFMTAKRDFELVAAHPRNTVVSETRVFLFLDFEIEFSFFRFDEEGAVPRLKMQSVDTTIIG